MRCRQQRALGTIRKSFMYINESNGPRMDPHGTSPAAFAQNIAHFRELF